MSNKYSILMSVYYKEKPEFLRESINSMLNQTVKAEEFVIVKDGPLTDELNEVLNEYECKNKNLFKIVSLEKNVGLGPALAIGLNHCKNELIARMDSDDYSRNDRCEKQLKLFENDPELEIVGSYGVEFEKEITNKIAVHTVPIASNDIHKFMKRRCALIHPTLMYKKSSILKCGSYRDVRLYEDYDMLMRLIIENKAKGYNIPEELYFVRISNDFFERRGGLSYMKTVVSFKWKQFRKGYMTLVDFIISAGGQGIVCLLPNKLRKRIYINMLREK